MAKTIDFDRVVALAAKRKGGSAALEDLLAETSPRTPTQIAAMPDDRVLAEMARRIFNAGFSSKVIDGKWPAFEVAFCGFDPSICASIVEDRFDLLMQDEGIVRNATKIRSVQINARLLMNLAAEHGSAARFFAHWPDDDFVGLMIFLKEHGCHLGGDAGMRFLRAIGKPSFILTKDVVAALVRETVVPRAPTSNASLQKVQEAFNLWSKQSGRNLTAISRVLAMSVDS